MSNYVSWNNEHLSWLRDELSWLVNAIVRDKPVTKVRTRDVCCEISVHNRSIHYLQGFIVMNKISFLKKEKKNHFDFSSHKIVIQKHVW